MNFPVLPPSASTIAHQTDAIYFSLIGMSVFFIVIIFGPMFYFLFRYRRGKKINRTMPNLPTTAIEITWTVIPLILVLGAFAWGNRVYFEEEKVPEGAMELSVLG